MCDLDYHRMAVVSSNLTRCPTCGRDLRDIDVSGERDKYKRKFLNPGDKGYELQKYRNYIYNNLYAEQKGREPLTVHPEYSERKCPHGLLITACVTCQSASKV